MDKPKIHRISSPSNSSQALVIIQGSWSQNNDPTEVWLSGLRNCGWRGEVYELSWDSSEVVISHEATALLTWKKVKDRADKVGKKYFSELICSIPQREISLIAHSAGVRIIHYGLKKWSGCGKHFQDAILLAGAMRRDEDWDDVAFRLDGNLINIHNKEDPALNHYHVGAFGKSPCGRKPIKKLHRQIVNLDATNALGKTHEVDDYLGFLPYAIRQGHWRP
ncbi:MAG: DUF726 domain-containing protein [Elainellaceae cyanobacterium]